MAGYWVRSAHPPHHHHHQRGTDPRSPNGPARPRGSGVPTRRGPKPVLEPPAPPSRCTAAPDEPHRCDPPA